MKNKNKISNGVKKNKKYLLMAILLLVSSVFLRVSTAQAQGYDYTQGDTSYIPDNVPSDQNNNPIEQYDPNLGAPTTTTEQVAPPSNFQAVDDYGRPIDTTTTTNGWTTNANGTQTYTDAQGYTTTYNADGSYTLTSPDGTTTSTYDANGNTISTNSNATQSQTTTTQNTTTATGGTTTGSFASSASAPTGSTTDMGNGYFKDSVGDWWYKDSQGNIVDITNNGQVTTAGMNFYKDGSMPINAGTNTMGLDASGGYWSKDQDGNTFYNDKNGNVVKVTDGSGNLTQAGQQFYQQGLMPQNAYDSSGNGALNSTGFYSKAPDGSLYYTDKNGNSAKVYNSDGTITAQGQAVNQTGLVSQTAGGATTSLPSGCQKVNTASSSSALSSILGSVLRTNNTSSGLLGGIISSLTTGAYNTLARAIGLPQVNTGQMVLMSAATGQPLMLNGQPVITSNGQMYTTSGQPVTLVNGVPQLASTSQPVVGYLSSGQAVYGYSTSGQPITGYSTSGTPIYSTATGSNVLYDANGNPLSSSSTLGSSLNPATTLGNSNLLGNNGLGTNGLATGGGWNIGNLSGFGLPSSSISGIVSAALMWILGIFGAIGVIGFVISGIMYLTAAGDQTQAERAKKAMTYSIIGIVVALSGLVIITAVNMLLSGSSQI